MSIVLNTPSNGSVTLAEQDTPNNVVVTIPSINGSFVTTNSVGNVGIGITPRVKLDVFGQILGQQTFGNSSAAGLRTMAEGTAQGQLGGISFYSTFQGTADSGPRRSADIWSGFNAGNWGTQYLSFGVGSAQNDVEAATPERVRIDATGNVLFGTTAVPNGTSIYGSGFTPTGNNRMELFLASNTTAAANLIRFFNPNGQVGVIATSGTATSYTTSSDYRLKENVQPMTDAIATVLALKPVTYTWKSDGSAGQGFIAHELQSIVPDCVTGEKDALDSEGNPQYQGIDTSFLIATLVAAIQELKAEFDDYKLTHP